jgi:hypothetical protein
MNIIKPSQLLKTIYMTSLTGLLFNYPMSRVGAQSSDPPVNDLPQPTTPGGPRNTDDPPVFDIPGGTESGGPRFISPFPPLRGITMPGAAETMIDHRGGCIADQMPLKPLMPANQPLALTVSEYPSFFVYLPANTAQSVEFVLQDENQLEIYKTQFKVTGKAGVIWISLPANATLPALEIGKNYQWSFMLICDEADRSISPFVTGVVQRIEPSAALKTQLAAAKGRQTVQVYAANGIWYDALKTLAELRLINPDNPQLISDWQIFLKSAGLEDLAEATLSQQSEEFTP